MSVEFCLGFALAGYLAVLVLRAIWLPSPRRWPANATGLPSRRRPGVPGRRLALVFEAHHVPGLGLGQQGTQQLVVERMSAAKGAVGAQRWVCR